MKPAMACIFTLALVWASASAWGEDQWAVAYKGREAATRGSGEKERPVGDLAKSAAEILAKQMGRVLKTEIKAAPWGEAQSKNVFLITEAQFAPESVRKELEGKALDAFAIKYPCEVDGRKVCLLVSKDNMGHDFPVYHFLTKFMGMEWVGPTDLGEVFQEQPKWTMPEKIDVLENPAYQHRALGIQEDMDSHAWLLNGRRLMFHHSMGRVYDPRLYGDQPDIYPYYDGKRQVPDMMGKTKRTAQWQPCTSNPKVISMGIDFGVQYLKDNPDQLSFGLSVNDGGGYCLCEKCRALDPKSAFDYGNPRFSDRYYKFYNEVMEGVLKQNPDAWMAVLGYSRVQTPPVETKINPRIIVFNCMDNLGAIPDMSERQKAWAKAGATPALYLRIGDVSFLSVQHCPHALADIIRLTKELGGLGFYTETCQNWAASGPRLYALAHLLWDAKANVEELQDHYMKLAFGAEAAPAARAYFDQWEKIYERRPSDERYDFMRGKGDYVQLDSLTREDLAILDAALEKAQAARASANEKKRLGYVTTYYKWLRLNADQYLLARELSGADWIAQRTNEAVLDEAGRGLAIADEFDRMTNDVILTDQTGWLWTKRVPGEEAQLYRESAGQVRLGTVAVYKSAIDDAFGRITERLLKEQPKEKVAAYWTAQAAARPALAPWAQTQAQLLEKGPGKNLLANPGFEQGTAGNPPRVEAWELGANYMGVDALFAWEPGSGRNGGRAIAGGVNHVGEITQEVPISGSERYRFSVWYKTTKDINPTVRLFITGLPIPRVVLPVHPAPTEWRQYSLTFSGADIIAQQAQDAKDRASNQMTAAQKTLKDTQKELAKLSRESSADKQRLAKLQEQLAYQQQRVKDLEVQLSEGQKPPASATTKIQLQPKTLDKGEWVYFDDAELVQIGGARD